MDFKLSDEQRMLEETVGRLVRDGYPFDVREKPAPASWVILLKCGSSLPSWACWVCRFPKTSVASTAVARS